MGKTASELMAELASNKEYQAQKGLRDKYFSELEVKCANDEYLLVKELNRAGFPVSSVWDFVNSKTDYTQAESILISHLKVYHHPKILAGIARALAVEAFSANDELWNLLVELYKKTPSDSDINIPEQRGAQEAIAVALECLATPQRVHGLKKIVEDKPNGDGIKWLEGVFSNLCQ